MKSRYYELNGKTQTLAEWCRELGLPYLRVYMRIGRGASFEEAITRPFNDRSRGHAFADREIQITIGEKTKTLRSWCTELKVSYTKVYKRIKKGWDPIQALGTHKRSYTPGIIEARREAEMIGRQFGRLVVVAAAGVTKHPKRLWRCMCQCGTETTVPTDALHSGTTQSCGCLRAEGTGNRTHGQSRTRVYVAWTNMIQRCTNEKVPQFSGYGGRGIAVCERWQSFENFYADMGEPLTDASIDRIDNNGNYEPSNCRWASRHQQSRNTRQNVYVTIDGETKVITDWCRQYGITQASVNRRLGQGMTLVDAITNPKKR